MAAVLAIVSLASEFARPSSAMAQAGPDGAPVVSLTEARRRAASVDPDAVAARGQVTTAVWERRAAVADLITPRLTAGGSYTHSPDSVFNFGTFGLSRTATNANLQASYSFLGAGKLGALRSARASIESAEAGETAERFRTSLATDAAYFAVLANRELARAAADRLRRAEEQFDIARVRVLAGEAIAPDSLQLLVEMNRARLSVLQRDSALVTSSLRLGRQIGVDGPAEAAPIDTAIPPSLPMTQDQAIGELRSRGPEVEAARAAERRADAVVLAEREAYLPTITVGATRAAYDREVFPSATWRTEYAVVVSFPIWNAGYRELDVARARVDRDVAKAARQDRERGAGEVMARAYRGYATSRAAIELAQAALAATAENFRVQSARYREGATTILDLLEAQVALSEAEAGLVQARYSTRLALAEIEALLGRRIFEQPTGDR